MGAPSQYPLSHGVLKNGHALSAEHQTLAEMLQGRGYEPGAIVGSFVLDATFERQGDGVRTVSEDGTVRYWTTTTHARLAEMLRDATRTCLPVDVLVSELFLDRADAERRDRTCRRCSLRPG